MGEPLVSIIIPVYNTGRYVRNILDAIINQTYKNIELIIVDDGSTDDSVNIIKNHMSSTVMKWMLIQLENGGVSKARNKGIDIAKGEWIFCPDSDDWIAPSTIDYLLSSVIANNAQCAFCEYKSVDEATICEPPKYDRGIEILSQEQLNWHNMIRKTNIVIPGMIIHRTVFNKIAFDEQCPYSEDTLYTWELIYQVNCAVWVKSDLYNYLKRENSKQHSLTSQKCMKSIERYSIMTKRIIESHPNDKLALLILPKFVLAAMHVFARCNDYKEFKKVYGQTGAFHFDGLYKLKNIKLSVFSFLYIHVPYMFYKVARLR